jgi:hypothetical protein
MRGIINCIGIILLMASCNEKKENQNFDDSEIRYRYYQLQNVGWKSKMYSQVVDNINFTAVDVPIQYYLLKDQGNQNLKKVDSIYEANKTERVIEFSFQDKNEEDLLQEKYTKLDYQKSVEYMSFIIQKDFKVVANDKDTIQCSGVSFERNFKIAPSNKIMLYFSGINPNDRIQLIYQDNLFQKGPLKFSFKEKILIP